MHKFYKLSAGVLAIAVAAGCSTSNSHMSAQPGGTAACKKATEAEIASLFDRWNGALQTGNPKNVVALYDKGSILLPTVSNKPRRNPAEIEDYFVHFMAKKPAGKIDLRHIQIGCNEAIDSGLYTFAYGKTGEKVSARYTFTYRWNGSEWKISSHHSSGMPEKPGAAAH
ncbi:MAG: SgcJ/EcaC family oxidoreductase [Brachymonas sp.]|nr:SgcJ/EcaC family oxidoreductase [Brachymonas sp.]